jgi:hypothetical protein
MFRRLLFWSTLCQFIGLVSCQFVVADTVSLPFIKNGLPQFQVKALSDDPALSFVAQQVAQVLPELTGNNNPAPATAWTLSLDIANDALKTQNLTREKIGGDGYVIVRNSTGVLVTGYTGRAVLYGVFHLVRQATGFIWTRPLIGSIPVVPVRDAALNMALPFTSRPVFSERGLSLSYMAWKSDNDNMLNWLVRNGLNMNALNTANYVDAAPAREKRGLPLHVHGHSFAFLVPPMEFGKTHPEYFSLVDGKRKIASRNSQLCMSNPAVVDLVAQRLQKMLDEEPDLQTVGLAPNDGSGGWCECAQCVAMDSPLDKHQPFLHGVRSYSTRYIKFANQVAQRLKAKHPQVRIHVYAYTNYIAAPDTEVDSALEVEFCAMYRCTVHAFNDANCPRNAAFDRFLQSWLPKTRHIFVRDYFLMIGSGTARSMPTSLYTLQQDLQYYQSQKLLGMVPEMVPDGPNGANVPLGEPYAAWLRAPSYYTETWDAGWLLYHGMSQLLWNPERDVAQIIRRACDSHYGPAGALMAQYHQRLHQNWYQSGRLGEMPSADKITTFSENVKAGPFCLGWGYAPRITWQANHLFNIQPDHKTNKAELTNLAQILLDAREIARKQMLPELRDRIETDVQTFQVLALSQGYEIDFRQGQTEVKFMSTVRE